MDGWMDGWIYRNLVVVLLGKGYSRHISFFGFSQKLVPSQKVSFLSGSATFFIFFTFLTSREPKYYSRYLWGTQIENWVF